VSGKIHLYKWVFSTKGNKFKHIAELDGKQLLKSDSELLMKQNVHLT